MITDWKNIKIGPEHHQAVVAAAQENGGLTIQSMTQAMIRGWAFLTAEQQLAAIKGKPSPVTAPVGSALADDDATIIEAGASSVRCASALMTTVAKATQDGTITDAEANEINAEATALVASACSCAAAAKKRHPQHN